jgi:hypothetical protein
MTKILTPDDVAAARSFPTGYDVPALADTVDALRAENATLLALVERVATTSTDLEREDSDEGFSSIENFAAAIHARSAACDACVEYIKSKE